MEDQLQLSPWKVLLEKEWEKMETGITKLKKIFESKGTTTESFRAEEYIELYTTVFNMCTNVKWSTKISGELYRRYKEVFDEYLVSTVLVILRKTHHEFLLKELLQRWDNHKVMVRWLCRFFQYLDRYYVPGHRLTNLNSVGVSSFQTIILLEDMKGAIKGVILDQIERERNGERIDRLLLKNVLHMFVEIGSGEMSKYEADLESCMLEDSSSYYSRKASLWIVQDSCPDYMVKVEDCLKREKERVAYYFHSSMETKLLERVKDELLARYAKHLLGKEDSGCSVLLRDNKFDDLSRMFRLFDKIPTGLASVCDWFKQHVTKEGMDLVQKAEDAALNKAEPVSGGHGFVRGVLDLHDKSMDYVTRCFANHSLFHKGLREAFGALCNKMVAGNPSGELFALYCDNFMKKGSNSRMTEEKMEETLDKVVILLTYINDKDVFAEFQRKKLARRLLFDYKSVNDDHERLLLTKLKLQFGAHFTLKMEGMVNDLIIGKEFQKEYESHIRGTSGSGIDFCVTVLTTGCWPNYKSSNLTLPEEMARCVESFKEFYATKEGKRKLSWKYSLGSCNIKANFKSQTVELVVGTYQAAVLMLFNNAERLSVSEIKGHLTMEEEDVGRVLHSLSFSKHKILKKQDDLFQFNSEFRDKMRRIRIPLPQAEDKKKIIQDVDKDRRYTIDASLVRIMKSRKVLSHQLLVQECVEQMSSMFKPDIKLIKKRIEDLIARDYLERDKDKSNMYKYLA